MLMINTRKLIQLSIAFCFFLSCEYGVPQNALTTKLSAPSNLSSSSVSSSGINLSWTDNSDNESGFRIERASDNGGSAGAFSQIATVQTNMHSYSDTGLNSSTKYYYRVNSYNSSNNSAYSNIANATTNPPPTTIPNSPSGLTANTVSSSGINLSWVDNSNNEEGFRVERAPDNGGIAGTFSLLTTVATNINSYNDTGLSASTKYYYRLRAYNSVGNSGYSNEANATTQSPPVTVPDAPTNLISNAVSSNAINLSWTDNSNNEEGFSIERALDNGGSAGTFSLLATVATNINSYSDTGLSASTKYYYRIRAYNSVGNSNYSNETSATTQNISPPTQIIADHTVVDKYDKIPQQYINEVKKMLVDMAGESHSGAYRIGQNLLELLDSKYQVETYDGTCPAYTDQRLRIGRHGSVGEAAFYTTQTAINAYKSNITTQYNTGNPYSVMGFGWCWDMTWQNSPGGTLDPVYNVHWAGSSEGGPQGSLRWGLDSGDQALTGNSVCMDTYLNAVEQYIQHCIDNSYPTKIVFTTGPVDGNSGTENGFQREIKHDYIRAYVAANSSRILFDYADILCWSNAGVKNTVNWNDGGNLRPHAQIHSENMMDYDASWNLIAHSEDGDHIGEVGALRIAKAMWWMLARIAGWDGISTN